MGSLKPKKYDSKFVDSLTILINTLRKTNASDGQVAEEVGRFCAKFLLGVDDE